MLFVVLNSIVQRKSALIYLSRIFYTLRSPAHFTAAVQRDLILLSNWLVKQYTFNFLFTTRAYNIGLDNVPVFEPINVARIT